MIKNNNETGFTLIELIVVMAIIAILVLLAAPRFLGYTKDANVTAMEQDTKVLSDATELYYINKGEWPITNRDNPITFGVGGVNEVYPIDELKLDSSIKNIKGNFDDYGIAIGGSHAGKVFHLNGVEDKDGFKDYGNQLNSKRPVSFDGIDYSDIGDVPKSPHSWFDFEIDSNGEGYIVSASKELNESEEGIKIVIPSEYNGLPVTSVKDSLYPETSFKNVDEVILPDTITRIGDRAFRENNIKVLYIPSSVDYIGVAAFANNQITTLNNIDHVQTVMNASFNGNQLDDSQSFIYKRDDEGNIDTSFITSYAGKNQHPIIPVTVTTIGYTSFQNTNIQTIDIPKRVTLVDNWAFSDNAQLKEVYIHSTTNTTGHRVFDSHTKIISKD